MTAASEGLRTIQAVSADADYTLTAEHWPSRKDLIVALERADAKATKELLKSNVGAAEKMKTIQDKVVSALAEELKLSYNVVHRR